MEELKPRKLAEDEREQLVELFEGIRSALPDGSDALSDRCQELLKKLAERKDIETNQVIAEASEIVKNIAALPEENSNPDLNKALEDAATFLQPLAKDFAKKDPEAGLSISAPAGASKTPPTPKGTADTAEALDAAADMQEEEPFHIEPLRAYAWNLKRHNQKCYEALGRFNDQLFEKVQGGNKEAKEKAAFNALNESMQKVARSLRDDFNQAKDAPPKELIDRMKAVRDGLRAQGGHLDTVNELSKEILAAEKHSKQYDRCAAETHKRTSGQPVYIERVKNWRDAGVRAPFVALSRRGYVAVNETEGSISSDSDWVVPYKQTLRMGKEKGLFNDFDEIYVTPKFEEGHFKSWMPNDPATWMESRNYVRRVTTALNENLYPKQDVEVLQRNISCLTKWQKERLAEALAGYHKRAKQHEADQSLKQGPKVAAGEEKGAPAVRSTGTAVRRDVGFGSGRGGR